MHIQQGSNIVRCVVDILPDSVIRINGMDAYNVTFFDNLTNRTTAYFYPPVGFNYTGYANLTVINPDGGYGVGRDVIFFSIDCPQPGLIGRGTSCRSCPAGAICPGGNRIWPQEMVRYMHKTI